MPPAPRLAHHLFSLAGALLLLALAAAPAAADGADDCAQKDNLARSVEACTRLIEAGDAQGNELAALYRQRGLAEAMLGRAAEAVVDLSAALKLRPDWVAALIDRGNAHDDRGDQAAAIADYDRAIALDPEAVEAYYNRGVAHLKLGEAEKAIADYDRVIALDPARSMAFNNRGVAHELLGHDEQAAADWARAIELGGPTEAAWWQEYLVGRGHFSGLADGKMSEALKAGLLACARDPNC